MSGRLRQRVTDDDWRPEQPSKRNPDMETTSNEADILERLLQKDGFKTWGFVIYRCTYANNHDWQKFLDLYYSEAKSTLELYRGLDLLDDFAPTVIEDPSFEGATTRELREHFKTWAQVAVFREQNITALQASGSYFSTGRYRFFIMVDQESLESVLNAPDRNKVGMAFVRLVNAEWEPQVLDEDEIEALGGPPEEFEPLEGCTLEDVGWMKIPFDEPGVSGFVRMRDPNQWDRYYSRPPKIQSLTGG
ncbi:hypothetical protein N7468_000021 [Penicillium chermesinum]|uniref:Muramidase n=1 Tax=Penicillium chermesinum TaxID=63820 RepID=A0A9W9TYW6_9EURO|nr:uncharacterized protein N7468_000021 [Penicillium chermesinum]KAJ5248570.1 hypothetical protein N7468_000021 [Penicillium chermesinum]KAJ6150684.1 hypothetical protein N7470_007278 [Penicillium chermesinum]